MRFVVALFISMCFIGCTSIYFEEAQPEKTKDLQAFPTEYFGTYELDGDTFIVGEKWYSFPIVYANKYSLQEIQDSDELYIEGDLFFDKSTPFKEGMPFEWKNDSLSYSMRIRGYKYISDSLKVRKYKKYLVISEIESGEKYWSVFLIRKNEEKIEIFMNGRLKTKYDTDLSTEYDGELEHFEKITSFVEIDPNSYLINPSKSEFKKLVKEEFFAFKLVLNPLE